MADSSLDITQALDSPQKLLKIIDNGDSTYSIAVGTGGSSSTTVNGKYGTNHLDDYTTTSVTYIGQEDKDGVWRIIKIDETGNFPVFTYASITNNATLTTYTLAWAARATTATYQVYSSAF